MTDQDNGAALAFEGYAADDFSLFRFMMPGFAAIHPQDMRSDEKWAQALVQGNYLIDNWQCDLSSGLFSIGTKTRTRLSLTPDVCGLLDIVRSYARQDRHIILNILEEATATPSCFCYCTTIDRGIGSQTRLFCVGMSDITASAGRLHGIFAFPPLDG